MRAKIKKIHIKDAPHVPKLQVNLFSIDKLLSNGIKVQFNSNECIVRGQDGELIVMKLCKRNLYEINFTKGHLIVHLSFNITVLGI